MAHRFSRAHLNEIGGELLFRRMCVAAAETRLDAPPRTSLLGVGSAVQDNYCEFWLLVLLSDRTDAPLIHNLLSTTPAVLLQNARLRHEMLQGHLVASAN